MNAIKFYFKNRLKGSKNEKTIEVFDVLIRSKLRLQLFDLESGQDLLLDTAKNDYLARMSNMLEEDKTNNIIEETDEA